MTASETIHKAIKKHAGLSDFDDDAISEEVRAILRALDKADFNIIKKGRK